MNRCKALRIALVLAAGAALSGCRSTPATREPPNIYPLKQAIRAYVDSGHYLEDIAAIAAQADAWIRQRHEQRREGERLTIVLDLDETLLFNWPHINRNDLGYSRAVWDAWVAKGEAAAIEPVRDVYRSARQRGIDVVFITGRRERDRPGTLNNLERIGCTDFAALICKPDDATGTSAAYKTDARRRLVAEGRVIIANIGDQESDLVGGYAERTFKLPCPFYLTQ